MVKSKVASVGKKDLKIVRVISVLFYISFIVAVLEGLVFAAIAFNLGNSALLILGENFSSDSSWQIIYLVPSILSIIIGIFGIFVARGLWKFKNWARISGIFLLILTFVNYLFSLDTGLSSLISILILIIINVLMMFYLIKLKKLFK